MNDNSWIKLHRKSIKNPIFQKPLIWHYFQYCLIKANHEPQKIIWNGKEMIVEKGSFITGRKKASLETGLSIQNVRTAINILKSLRMIEKSTIKSTVKFTYLTVCNYEQYQCKKLYTNHQTNHQLTINQPSTNHQLTTNKNEKNIVGKNEKNEKNNIFSKRRKNIKVVFSENFERIWKSYPCKDGKKEACRHYKATVQREEDQKQIEQALQNYLKHLKINTWKRAKAGSTWFNNWQDWVNWTEPLKPMKTDPYEIIKEDLK